MRIMECHPTEFLIRPELDAPISLLRISADEKNISMKINADPDIKVRADKPMIDTVLRNLISNSIKFTRPGGNLGISVSE